jgi:hypothetical protein
MLNKVLVIFSRSCRLDRLPRKDVSDGVEAESSETCKVRSRIVFGERTLVEGYVIAVEEVDRSVRGLVGLAREFGIGSNVDAAENDLTTMTVTELAILD